MPKKFKTMHSVHFYDLDSPEVASSENITAPSFVQVLPASGFVGRDGRGPFTFDFDKLVAAFQANKADLPIDRDHQIYGASEGTDGAAYAWITGLAQYEDGSVWATVTWTDSGRYLVESRQYRYISPSFTFQPVSAGVESGEILKLVGASIVNLPNLVMTSLNSEGANTEAAADTQSTDAAATGPSTEDAQEALSQAQEGSASVATTEDIPTVVEEAPEAQKPDLSAVIAELLSLAKDYDDDAIVETIKILVADKAAVESKVAEHSAQLQVYTAKDGEVTAKMTALQSEVLSLNAELQAVKAAQHEEKVQSAVNSAISGGKFAPASRDSLLTFARSDLKNFELFVANSPKHAIMSTVAIRNKDSIENTFGLTDKELDVCKQTVIKPETFAKNKPKH